MSNLAELQAFAAEVSKIGDKLDDEHVRVLKKVALETHEKILDYSPVRSGRYRGSNNASLNSADSKTLPASDVPGTYGRPDASEAEAALSNIQLGDSVIFNNSVDYSQKIENGSSSQAPSGVYRLAEFYAETRLDEEVANATLPAGVK